MTRGKWQTHDDTTQDAHTCVDCGEPIVSQSYRKDAKGYHHAVCGKLSQKMGGEKVVPFWAHGHGFGSGE